jgi:hypothetical protein
MRSHRGGNGDAPSPGDDGLPDLPPEWGVVVIPDDLTELDRESALLRRQRRREARHSRWRRRLGLSPVGPDESGASGGPLLIMAIAIIAALTSLFAITLSTHVPATTSAPPVVNATPSVRQRMIDLALTDNTNHQVRLRQTLPAVILLLDGCTCEQLIRDVWDAAPATVTLLLVDRTPPTVPAGVKATPLADPEQALLATYTDGADRNATPAGQPSAMLVDAQGVISMTADPITTVVDIKQELLALAP